MQYLQRRFETQHMRISICEKEDLELPNHLSGLKHKFLKLAFSTYVLRLDASRFDKTDTLMPAGE